MSGTLGWFPHYKLACLRLSHAKRIWFPSECTCMPRSLLSEQFCKSCEESQDRSFFGIRQPCASHFEPNAIKLVTSKTLGIIPYAFQQMLRECCSPSSLRKCVQVHIVLSVPQQRKQVNCIFVPSHSHCLQHN